MKLRMNDKQRIIWHYDKKHEPITTLFEGAVRTGKTILMIYCFLRFVASFRKRKDGKGKDGKRWKRLNFIMVGKTMPTLKKNVLDEMEALFKIDIKLNKYNRFTLYGHTIHVFGSDTKTSWEKIRGFTAQGSLINEATLVHPRCITETFDRCSEHGFRHFLDTNPDEPTHFLKRTMIDCSGELTSTGRVRVKTWNFIIDDNSEENNGFLGSEYIEDRKKTTPSGFLYERNIGGRWTAKEGQIYKDWNPLTMFIDDCDLPTMQYYIGGADWGYEHFGSLPILGFGNDGKWYLVDGKREKHKDVGEYWKPLKDQYQNQYNIKDELFFCDSARPEYVEKFNGTNAKKAVDPGIAYVATLMKKGEFIVARSMQEMFEEEVYKYIWGKDGKPVKEFDDLMDGIRYALYSYSILGEIKSGYYNAETEEIEYY